MHSKIIATWTKPDNGLSIDGMLVFETNITSMDELIPENGFIHDDLSNAFEGKKVAAELFDDLENGDYEYDSFTDGNTHVGMLAISSHTFTFVLVPNNIIR